MSYYDILEVSPKASKEVIKNAYRALCKKYHPDMYKGDLKYAQEKMEEINLAYEVLMNDEKRLKYDYDNGFKIDPNAPIEEKEIQSQINIKDEEKTSKEKKTIKDVIKKKNVLIASAFLGLFIVAIFIGNIIASASSKDKEKIDTTTDTSNTTTNNTDSTYTSPSTQNNSYYNYNYNSNTKENTNNNNNNEEKNNTNENIVPKEEKNINEPSGES